MRLVVILFFAYISLFAQSIIDSPLVENIKVYTDKNKESIHINKLPYEMESSTLYNISFSLNLKSELEPVYLIAAMDCVNLDVKVDGKSIDPSFINRHPFYMINSGRYTNIKFIINSELPMNEIQLRILKNDDLIPFLLFERIWLGVALGILLAVAIYNGAFFIFNLEKSYLYYSLLQVCLFAIMSISMDAFSLVDLNVDEVAKWLESISSIALVFAILFGQSFLQTKVKNHILHKILNFFIFYYIVIFILNIFFEDEPLLDIFPSFPAIALLVYISLIRIKEKYKPAYFYFIGWSIFCLGIMVLELVSIDYDYLYVLAFSFSLEALVLSFAISYKVKLIEEDKKLAQKIQQEQQQMMLHQSRMAAMGDMVGSIAHQWRQPLTHLSYLIMNLKSAFQHGDMNDMYISQKSNEASKQIHYMSQTIEDFQNFYSPSKEKEKFKVYRVCENALQIMDATFKHYHVSIVTSFDNSIEFKGFFNELSQVLVAILENSKAIFKQRATNTPHIWITLTYKDDIRIEIRDNGGGVEGLNLKQIFEPFKTTRKDGSGMGLYMANLIVQEHFNGKIEANNTNIGVCFTIILPKK